MNLSRLRKLSHDPNNAIDILSLTEKKQPDGSDTHNLENSGHFDIVSVNFLSMDQLSNASFRPLTNISPHPSNHLQ